MVKYRIKVKDSAGDFIGEFTTYRNLSFGKRLNNYGIASFEIPVKDSKTASLISTRRYTTWIYREEDGVSNLVWAGEQALRKAVLDDKKNNWAEIISYTWLEQLSGRYTEALKIYTQVDQGEIAWDLIDRTQKQYTAYQTNEAFPGTAADDSAIGTLTWDTPNNIKTDNGSDASIEFLPGSPTTTHYIKGTNFGFSIPAEANILGVKASFETSNEGDSSRFVTASTVKLIKGGTIQGDNKGTSDKLPTTPPATVPFGGSNDLWGLSLTPSDVNASNFGVAISLTGTPGADFSLPTGIDYVVITVYYETVSDDDFGDFGITRGTIEPTTDRDRTYNNQNIMEAIINLSNVISGFDFEITDEKVFNVANILGTDLTDSIYLKYGLNVKRCTVTDDFTHPINRAIVLGEVIDEDELQRVDTNDTDLQELYKVREDVQSEMDVSEIATLEDKGEAMIRKYGLPLSVLTFDIAASTIKITDFSNGDLIRAIIKSGIFDIDEEYRIFEWELKFDEKNAEKLNVILGRFTI